MGEYIDWDKMAQSIGYENEKEMMNDFYVTLGWSVSRIAEKLGVGTATIARRLGQAGIDKRTRGGANNLCRLKNTLHRMDQRIVMLEPIARVAKLAGASQSLVYKYRRGVISGYADVIRDNQPDSGAEPVFDAKPRAFGAAAGS